MRPGGVAAIALLVLALEASAAAGAFDGWTNWGGGPERGGFGLLSESPLDVVRAFRVGDGPVASPGLIETPHGLVGVVSLGMPPGSVGPVRVEDDPRECGLLWLDASDGATRFRATACTSALTWGYDPSTDAVVACQYGAGERPIVFGVDAATGEPLWGATLADLAIATDADAAAAWHCGSATVDPARREVVAVLHAATGTRVAAIGLDDGTVRWSRGVPGAVFAGAGDPAPAPHPIVENAREHGFGGVGSTLSDTGIFIQGVVRTAGPAADVPGVVWLDRDGTVVGAVASASQSSDVRAVRGVSSEVWTASGSLGAVTLGTRLLVVNPSSATPMLDASLDLVEPEALAVFPPPAWWAHTLVVPLAHSVSAFDSRDLTRRWTWLESLEWRVSGVFIAPPSDVYVIAARPTPDGAEGAVFRLDVGTGDVLQRLPMPFDVAIRPLSIEGQNALRWHARPMMLAGGRELLVQDTEGNVVVLGRSDPARLPLVTLAEAYPALGAEVRLEAAAPPGFAPERITVSWGEGPLAALDGDGAASTRYATRGVRTVRVTAEYADGMTATVERELDVGGSPPLRLNAIQRAFAPENQDLTFGLLGVLIALVGGALAVGRRRRHRSLLDRELAILRDIRSRGLDAPASALRALGEYRLRIEGDLRSGRLNDSQFGVLSTQAMQAVATLREVLLAPFEGRMSPAYERRVAAALADGVMTRRESRDLVEALARERRLTARDREALAEALRQLAAEAPASVAP